MNSSNQRINDQLLARGSTTFGSYQRRVERLKRLVDLDKKQVVSRLEMNKLIKQQQAKISQRAKLMASEVSAIWALKELRNYKTETHSTVDIPVIINDARTPNLLRMSTRSGRTFGA